MQCELVQICTKYEPEFPLLFRLDFSIYCLPFVATWANSPTHFESEKRKEKWTNRFACVTSNVTRSVQPIRIRHQSTRQQTRCSAIYILLWQQNFCVFVQRSELAWNAIIGIMLHTRSFHFSISICWHRVFLCLSRFHILCIYLVSKKLILAKLILRIQMRNSYSRCLGLCVNREVFLWNGAGRFSMLAWWLRHTIKYMSIRCH